MKKHLFFAAFALSMMASCTNDDNLVVEQPTAPEDDRVAIQLGVDAPSITATGRAVSRGTGSVGDVEGANNKWSGQRLYIAMVDEDGNLAMEDQQEADGTPKKDAQGNVLKQEIMKWDSWFYKAPSAGSTGDILIYQKTQADVATTVQQYKYYPPQGTFDFYGWHVDDATTATPEISNGTVTVKDITINGTQDIMGARTIPFTEANTVKYDNKWSTDLNNWAFSARTARNDVKPILKFEHQLARLKFYVRAGKGSDNAPLYTDKNNTANNLPNGESAAMYVTALSVKDMVSVIDMDLNATIEGTTKGIKTVKCPDANTTLTTFHLGSKIADPSKGTVGTIGALEAVAPEYTYDENDDDTKGTQIGESIMFFPDGDTEDVLNLSLSLKQTVIDTEDDSKDDDSDKYDYIDKIRTDIPLIVKAASIVGGTGTKKFEAGKSYNIYITIYGFERIVVTAELTAWTDGGDIDVDIEDKESQVTTPTTPTNSVINFDITLPDGKTEANITVVGSNETLTYDANNKSLTLPYGTTEKTIQIKVDGYNVVEKTITPNQANVAVSVAQNEFTPEQQAPVNQTVTFTLKKDDTAVTDATLTVTYGDENTALAVTNNGDGTYTFEVPAGVSEINYTVAASDGNYVEKTDTYTLESPYTLELSLSL